MLQRSITNIHYGLPQNVSLLIMYVSQKIKRMPIDIAKEREVSINRTAWTVFDFDKYVSLTHLHRFLVEYEDDYFLHMELRETETDKSNDGWFRSLKFKVVSASLKSINRNRDGMTQIDLDITEELKQKLIECQEE